MTVIKQYNTGTSAWETIVVGASGPSPGAWTASTSATLSSTSGSPTLGTGATSFLDYSQVGKTVTGYIRIVLGTSPTSGTGTYYFAPPVAQVNRRANVPCGTFWANKSSTSTNYTGLVVMTTSGMYMASDSGTLTATVLGALTANDQFNLFFTYEAA